MCDALPVCVHCLVCLQTMGNSSGQCTLPQNAADRKKPLATQTVDRDDVAADDCGDNVKDRRSLTAGVPRSAFYSRLLVRNGKCNMLVFASKWANHGCVMTSSIFKIAVSAAQYYFQF